MSKKAIFTANGIFFCKKQNATAEAEQAGTEAPKKSFVSEEEFAQMVDDGLIVDFEPEAEQEQEPTAPAVPDMAEVLKRLEALEEENKRLKEGKPAANLADIKAAWERHDQLNEEADELLSTKEQLEALHIDPEDSFFTPELNFLARNKSREQQSFTISNPYAIQRFHSALIEEVSKRAAHLLEEAAAIESQF